MSGGTVAIIADQSARYSLFTQCLTGLFSALPYGTVVDWEIGAHQARSRNTLVRRALARETDWVLFLDDDHTFPPGLLDTLLSRNVPVVASLYLQRTDPFLPIAYATKDEYGAYWPLDLGECPEHGLVTVCGAGAGGMLIKADVLKLIEDPWFLHTTEQSEDLYFCDKVAAAGIQMYVDLDARLGHVMPISIYPDFEDGEWMAGMAASAYTKVCLPISLGPDDDMDDDHDFITPQEAAGGLSTRVEMYQDAEGRWHARGVTEEGGIIQELAGVFNEADALRIAQERWPALPVHYVADANADSTFVETDAQRHGIGQPGLSSRRSRAFNR